jgi:hypothetical protein
MEGVILEILVNMCMGGGRLDFGNVGRDYTMSEAKEAFERVARDHKWV